MDSEAFLREHWSSCHRSKTGPSKGDGHVSQWGIYRIYLFLRNSLSLLFPGRLVYSRQSQVNPPELAKLSTSMSRPTVDFIGRRSEPVEEPGAHPPVLPAPRKLPPPNPDMSPTPKGSAECTAHFPPSRPSGPGKNLTKHLYCAKRRTPEGEIISPFRFEGPKAVPLPTAAGSRAQVARRGGFRDSLAQQPCLPYTRLVQQAH